MSSYTPGQYVTPPPPSLAQSRQAARCVAAHAHDAADLRRLLDALGLLETLRAEVGA